MRQLREKFGNHLYLSIGAGPEGKKKKKVNFRGKGKNPGLVR